MSAPAGTAVPGEPVPRRPRGFLVGLVVGLLVTAGVVVGVRTGVLPPLEDPSSAGDGYTDAPEDDVPFTDADRLQEALDAAVADVGSTRAAQVVVQDGQFSAVLLDPATKRWTRYQESSSDEPGGGTATPLPVQPAPAAEFPLATVTGAGLARALASSNLALGDEPGDITYLVLVAERPFPAYGDVLLAVSDRYSASLARAWLTTDGTVLRAEVG